MIGWIEHVATAPWTITIGAVLAAFLIGRFLVRLARPVLSRMVGRTASDLDDRLVQLMASPLSVVLALQALRLAAPWLPLDGHARETLENAIGVITTLSVLWTAFRGIDLARSVLEHRSWALAHPSSRSVLAISARFTKVGVLAISLIVALAQLGVSVGSLIAGLGIGGLAVALAAQKTVENLFGALSIGVDQPMREGDLVKLYDFTGTVEQIGLRSTRIRTLDRTIITVPNGDLANQRIESFTARDRWRLLAMLGVVCSTTSAQMRAILADLEAVLRRHPKTCQDTISVCLKEIAASSLNIEVAALFETTDSAEFQKIRQELLLEFMAAIERHGSAMAFPTHTIHLEKGTAPAVGAPARS
jgi:MscS family membrane protein